MKRFLIFATLFTLVTAQAQDAAVEERLNKLSSYIEELQAAKVGMDKRITSLVTELQSVRDANKSNGNLATQEDIQRLTKAIEEVDRKRLEDYKRIERELQNLAKALSTPVAAGGKTGPRAGDKNGGDREGAAGGGVKSGSVPGKGFEHTIAAGDTLSTIAQAYREELKIKVTVEDILKANPGIKANSLIVGKKIFIPAE